MITVLLLDSVPDIARFRELVSIFDYVHVFDYAIKTQNERDIVKEIAEIYPYKIFIRTSKPEYYYDLPIGIHIMGYVKSQVTLSFDNPKSFSVHSLAEIPYEIPMNTVKVFVSPVFKPISKDKKAIPLFEQKEMVNKLRGRGVRKIIALGGITTDNAMKAIDRGFDGIAFYSAFKGNPNAVLRWLETIKETA